MNRRMHDRLDGLVRRHPALGQLMLNDATVNASVLYGISLGWDDAEVLANALTSLSDVLVATRAALRRQMETAVATVLVQHGELP